MENKAQIQTSLFLSILVALMLFFVGMIVVNFIMTSVTNARTDNSCASPSTDGGKALCLLFDIVVPYFFIIIIATAGGIITAKFLT